MLSYNNKFGTFVIECNNWIDLLAPGIQTTKREGYLPNRHRFLRMYVLYVLYLGKYIAPAFHAIMYVIISEHAENYLSV
jgi:hypothetical protein